MTGHNQVIYARSNGLPVECVFLEDAIAPPNPRNRDWLDPENALCTGALPVIYVADESPPYVDVAFLRGLRVHLVGDETRGIERWSEWFSLLQDLPVAHLCATYDGEVVQWRAP